MTPWAPPPPLCGWAEPTEAEHWTAAMVARLPDDGWRYELVRGRVVRMAPTYAHHGDYASAIDVVLRPYVRGHRLGRVYVGEVGWDLTRSDETEDTVLASDVAFVRAERLPLPPARPGKAFTPLAPDLVVEIASPTQFHRPDLGAKARTWLERGVLLVWVVWPDPRSVDVWLPGQDKPLTARGNDILNGYDVVPGFLLPLPAIWDED